LYRGCRNVVFDLAVEAGVTKSDASGTDLERSAIESDSLVRECIPISRDVS
jgi:hypothetical protein